MTNPSGPSPTPSNSGYASAPGPSATRRNTTAVALVGLVGGLMAVFTVGSGVTNGLGILGETVQVTDLDLPTNLASLRVDANAASVTVNEGSVARAHVEFRKTWGPGSTDLQARVEGDTVVVETVDPRWSLTNRSEAQVTITIPPGRHPDLSIHTGVGSVTAQGQFGKVTLDSTTGSLGMSGSATSLTAHASTGSISADVSGVDSLVELGTSTGSISLVLSGAPVKNVELNTSTGSIQARVPAAAYAVNAATHTGHVINELRRNDDSPYRITAFTNTGSITLLSN